MLWVGQKYKYKYKYRYKYKYKYKYEDEDNSAISAAVPVENWIEIELTCEEKGSQWIVWVGTK